MKTLLSCMTITCMLFLLSTKTFAQNTDNGYEETDIIYADDIAVPSNTIRVSGGPAWITSKVISEYGRASKKTGYELSVDYGHLWNTNNNFNGALACGFGINYSYNNTSMGIPGHGSSTLTQYYIGPSFVMEWRTVKNWIWSSTIGLGYAHYDDYGYTQGGFGYLARIGCEYMVTDHLGFGMQLQTIQARFEKPEGFQLERNESYGYDRIGLQVGARFYF